MSALMTRFLRKVPLSIVSTVFLASLLSVSAPGLAQVSRSPNETISNEYQLNWIDGRLVMQTTRDILSPGGNAPIATHITEREAANMVPHLINTGLSKLRINSAETMGQFLERNPERAPAIMELVPHVQHRSSRRNTALTTLQVEYQLDLYPHIVELIGTHTVASPLPRSTARPATRDFSGIVIYAADLLPIHGTVRQSVLEPALMPRLFDTEMNPILDASMVDPNYLRSWGVAAYDDDWSAEAHNNRIGDDPLRILARGLFGESPTDLLISTADAERILASEHNRRLLQQGRILIVLNQDTTQLRFNDSDS